MKPHHIISHASELHVGVHHLHHVGSDLIHVLKTTYIRGY